MMQTRTMLSFVLLCFISVPPMEAFPNEDDNTPPGQLELARKFNVDKTEVSAMVANLNKTGHLDQWIKVVTQPRPALLIIDLQNDFITGSLKVANAQDIIAPISSLAGLPLWHKVILSQDWHPSTHISFYSNLHLRPLDDTWLSHHPGNISMFDKVTFAGPPPQEQVLWPDHCIQGSEGAKIHKDLTRPAGSQVIQKGTNPEVDSYSAFYDNTGRGTGSTGMDKLVEDVTEVVVSGLATDYCVGSTAIDALCLGIPTTLLSDLSRAVTAKGEEDMFGRVKEAGGQIMTVVEWEKYRETWDYANNMAEFLTRKDRLGVCSAAPAFIKPTNPATHFITFLTFILYFIIF